MSLHPDKVIRRRARLDDLLLDLHQTNTTHMIALLVALNWMGRHNLQGEGLEVWKLIEQKYYLLASEYYEGLKSGRL